jgi:two-component system sensor histidine kinase/response regulator
MTAPKILVVDDQPVNVQLLKRRLERDGMQAISAHRGHDALALVAKDWPDLILLDVMMPDMDGIEVCQRLQANEDTRPIPVIFITARASKEGKLEGLGVGAVDYITKPIDLDETVARVQTQLRFVTVNRQLLDLTRRLEELRQTATIGAVTQGIAHNLNNLLGVVLGYLELICAHSNRPEVVEKNSRHAEEAVQRIADIIRQLNSLVVRVRLSLTRCRLDDLLAGAVARFHHEHRLAPTLAVENTLGPLAIDTHGEIFEDALGKLLLNAWEAYGDPVPPAARRIWLRAELVEYGGVKKLRLTVEEAGRGIAPTVRDKVFEPFVSTKQTVGVDMGLTVVRHALRNLGGDVALTDRPGGGAVVTLIHPLEKRRTRDDDSRGPFARNTQ